MFSAESEEKQREKERKESEWLALKKKDVRRKVRRYDRLHGTSKTKARNHESRVQCGSYMRVPRRPLEVDEG